MFLRSKDGTPIGPISQWMSSVKLIPGMKTLGSASNVTDLTLIEGISDYETSTFIQLVFALTVPNLSSYSIPFATAFLHSIKLIETYFEEMCLCISDTDFYHSSLVRKNIRDTKFRTNLNQALENLSLEYGGLSYRSERVHQIRIECLKKNTPGLLHRIWPQLGFASTAIGSSFAVYKKEIEFYCGEQLPLINLAVYLSSEGFFGALASIHTDEYFLTPSTAFFEFIKEEDINQAQPKTLLISEIEPGQRYELVCTTDSGLVRYRLGDVVYCTRYLSQADNTVPLPFEQEKIPRIPLVSIAYRVGNLISITGENTTEQHVMDALQRTVQIWKQQEINVDIYDFTLYPKLDTFPSRYVMFLELFNNNSQSENKIIDRQQCIVLNDAMSEIERQLCEANDIYKDHRNAGKIGSLICLHADILRKIWDFADITVDGRLDEREFAITCHLISSHDTCLHQRFT
ncbi:unnamed protein product [Rotaria sp. Silwood1]|nr:unnamed protein product [Rotaria sp. Silwood1]